MIFPHGPYLALKAGARREIIYARRSSPFFAGEVARSSGGDGHHEGHWNIEDGCRTSAFGPDCICDNDPACAPFSFDMRPRGELDRFANAVCVSRPCLVAPAEPFLNQPVK